MTAIPKRLAKGIDIRLAARIQAAVPQAERWQVVTESGDLFEGDALLMTPPVPQSLHILAQEAWRYQVLSRSSYSPLRTIAASPYWQYPPSLPGFPAPALCVSRTATYAG